MGRFWLIFRSKELTLCDLRRNATALGAIVKRSIAVARKSTAYIGVESRVHFDEDWHMESKRYEYLVACCINTMTMVVLLMIGSPK